MDLTTAKQYVKATSSLTGTQLVKVLEDVERAVLLERREIGAAVAKAIADYDAKYSASSTATQSIARRNEIQDRVMNVIIGGVGASLSTRRNPARG